MVMIMSMVMVMVMSMVMVIVMVMAQHRYRVVWCGLVQHRRHLQQCLGHMIEDAAQSMYHMLQYVCAHRGVPEVQA